MQKNGWRILGVGALALTAACGASDKHESLDQGDDAAAGTEEMGSGGSAGHGAGGGGGGTKAGAGNGGSAIAIGGSSTRGGAGGASAMAGTSTRGGSSGQGGGVTAGQSTGGSGAGGIPTSGGAAGAGAGGMTSAGGMAGAPGDETLTSCATWKVQRGQSGMSTAELVEGGLLLTRPGGSFSDDGPYNGADIAISQSGLTGDFDVVVAFDELEPSDGKPFQGPTFTAGVWHHSDNGEIWQANGRVGQGVANVSTQLWPVEGMGVGDTESVDHTIVAGDMWLVGASGTIELSRTGTSITATITVNGESATYTPPEAFDVDPLDLFLQIANTAEDYGMTDMAVRITSVMVTGDGIMSDTFDCSP